MRVHVNRGIYFFHNISQAAGMVVMRMCYYNMLNIIGPVAYPFNSIKYVLFTAGWASIYRGNADGAVAAMRQVAQAKDSPSVEHGRAILGALRFHQGAADEAVQAWQAMDAQRRTAWKLAEPLQGTLFVAGLQALGKGHYEQAADKFREAGKAGLREQSLGSLIHYALVKAGQQLLDGKGAG